MKIFIDEYKNMAKRLKYKYHRNGTVPQLPSPFVLVFGSNERGLHKVGFSEVAHYVYGAEMGVAFGVGGRSYAIPVKDRFIRILDLNTIRKHVAHFVEYTHDRPELRFWVTDIATDRREYKPYHIAPFFRGCRNNCSFPESWKPYLK